MDIDYASVFALTVYGKIGIKVWICKGEVLGKRDLNPNFTASSGERQGGRPEGRSERPDRDRGGDRRGGGERRQGQGAGAGRGGRR
jgi:small subunit ribosomal protein S3